MSKRGDFVLNRILSGQVMLKFENTTYFYSHPSPKLLYKADILENEIILNNTESMTEEEAQRLLIESGRWSEQKQKEIDEEIPKILEELKIQVYLSFVKNPQDVPSIKTQIKKIKTYLYKLLTEKHKFDEYTIESIASRERTLFLLKKCVKGIDVKPELLLNTFYSSRLDENDFRKTARSEEWIVKWNAGKHGCKPFSGNLNEEQEQLIKWTSIYDNIAQLEDKPPREVIEDDDALDGYFLFKNIETKDKDKLAEIENRYAKKGKKYNELYLPAKDLEEAKRINALNSPEAVKIKENRFKQINEQGVVNEIDFADRKFAINLAKNQREFQ